MSETQGKGWPSLTLKTFQAPTARCLKERSGGAAPGVRSTPISGSEACFKDRTHQTSGGHGAWPDAGPEFECWNLELAGLKLFRLWHLNLVNVVCVTHTVAENIPAFN